MRTLLFAAIACLLSSSSAWAWPSVYVAVAPPGPVYVQYGRVLAVGPVAPAAPMYLQYSRPLLSYYSYSMPAVVSVAPAASYVMPQAAVMPAASDDTAAALARLQAEVRLLTQEANVRALQSRVIELEKRQAVPSK
jgi:hypothetical protein